MKRKTREEEVTRLFLYQLHAQWRTRRDGKMFKCWWATKATTTRLMSAKAQNRGRFHENEHGSREWEGVISHDGVTMIARVVVAPHGASYITVTREGRKS